MPDHPGLFTPGKFGPLDYAAGGRIFVQLMHAGRVSHSSLLPGHALPVAPSAICVSGEGPTFGMSSRRAMSARLEDGLGVDGFFIHSIALIRWTGPRRHRHGAPPRWWPRPVGCTHRRPSPPLPPGSQTA